MPPTSRRPNTSVSSTPTTPINGTLSPEVHSTENKEDSMSVWSPKKSSLFGGPLSNHSSWSQHDDLRSAAASRNGNNIRSKDGRRKSVAMGEASATGANMIPVSGVGRFSVISNGSAQSPFLNYQWKDSIMGDRNPTAQGDRKIWPNVCPDPVFAHLAVEKQSKNRWAPSNGISCKPEPHGWKEQFEVLMEGLDKTKGDGDILELTKGMPAEVINIERNQEEKIQNLISENAKLQDDLNKSREETNKLRIKLQLQQQLNRGQICLECEKNPSK